MTYLLFTKKPTKTLVGFDWFGSRAESEYPELVGKPIRRLRPCSRGLRMVDCPRETVIVEMEESGWIQEVF